MTDPDDGAARDPSIPSLDALEAAWTSAIESVRNPAGPTRVLYSGGLDSSFVAHCLRRDGPVELFAIGFPGCADLIAATSGARLLDLPLATLGLDDARIRDVCDRFFAELRGAPAPARAVAVGMICALEASRDRALVCGQGADELFFGYAHFLGLGGTRLEDRRESDLRALLHEEWPRTERLAIHAGTSIHAPFLHPALIRVVLGLPVPARPLPTLRKPLLRAWARASGLPEELVLRPKRAFQYGSGIDRAIRRYDRYGITP